MNSKLKRFDCFDKIMTKQKNFEALRNHYADDRELMPPVCRMIRSEGKNSVRIHNEKKGLRLATINDLYRIVPIEAAMAKRESGSNPLSVDSEEFISKCARRIIKKQVWIPVENDKLTGYLVDFKGIDANFG